MSTWVVGLALHELGRPADAVASYRAAIDGCAAADGPELDEIEALATAGLAISLLGLGQATDANREMARARRRAPEAAQPVVEMLYGLLSSEDGSTQRRAHDLPPRRTRRSSGWATSRRWPDCGSTAARCGPTAVTSMGRSWTLTAPSGSPSPRTCPCWPRWPPTTAASPKVGGATCPPLSRPTTAPRRPTPRLEHPDRLVAVLQADRCEILLLAGLVVEAETSASAAIAAIEATGDQAHLAESRLLLARALLAGGSYAEAATQAGAWRADIRAGQASAMGRAGPLSRDAGRDPALAGRRAAARAARAQPPARDRARPARLAHRGGPRAHVRRAPGARSRTASGCPGRAGRRGCGPQPGTRRDAGTGVARGGAACPSPRATGPRPVEPSPTGWPWSTATGPAWARPNCAPALRATAPSSLAWALGCRSTTAGRARCCAGPSAGGLARCVAPRFVRRATSRWPPSWPSCAPSTPRSAGPHWPAPSPPP